MEPTFGLTDLKLIKVLIEVLTKRAAFNPNELSDVGNLYNKLSTFIAAADAAIENNKSPEGK